MAVVPALHPAPPRPASAPATVAGVPPRVAAGAALLLLGVLVLALVVGGGRPEPATPGLPDAGAVTGWGQPVVDLLVRLLAVLTVGQLLYAAVLAPAGATGPGGGALRALRGASWSALAWLGAEAVALVLTASALYGVPVTSLSLQGVAALTVQLPVGRSSLLVGLLLGALLLGAFALGATAARPRPARLLLLLALSAVVVPVVLAGHSAAAEDHVAAVVSLSAHVVAASLWVGGLAGLLLHGRAAADPSVAVLRFSTLALLCVVLLGLSGSVAAVLVAGRPSAAWLGEGWVWLLGAKTALLLGLAAMGGWHRRRTLPALRAGRPGAFARLGAAELVLMGVAVTVSVALAVSPAPAVGTATADGGPAVAATTGGTTGGTTGDTAGDEVEARVDGPDGVDPVEPADTGVAAGDAVGEDMSGHDHGDLSVSVLVDPDRFHVAAPVRPAQRVTVYNNSEEPATITARDGSFDVEVPARTFITFEAPATVGDHPFVSRAGGADVPGFADVLRVREAG